MEARRRRNPRLDDPRMEVMRDKYRKGDIGMSETLARMMEFARVHGFLGYVDMPTAQTVGTWLRGDSEPTQQALNLMADATGVKK
jgi:hypothetical protein